MSKRINPALFQGFSKLSRQERFERLMAMGVFTEEDLHYLSQGGIQDMALAETFIENGIGYFQLPLGVATYFCVNGRDVLIPMAVEETSIVAALSKTAKWIRESGRMTTEINGSCIIGQIQIPRVQNLARLSTLIEEHKAELIQKANLEVALNMTKRGGGVMDIQVRSLLRQDGDSMAIIHVHMNTCDAMGANILNQVLEYLKHPIEQLTQEKVQICILSNLNDCKLTTATIEIPLEDAELGVRIEEASYFAELDPYRAATHNK
ncbi:MAG: hydroxymethylglutaryl-CoA reductase, degradative, partial [Legionellaceae bacterium]|nr:hydroxymethylglutaryl-CoA reductase, degradative [Legionellaceae bacterium]